MASVTAGSLEAAAAAVRACFPSTSPSAPTAIPTRDTPNFSRTSTATRPSGPETAPYPYFSSGTLPQLLQHVEKVQAILKERGLTYLLVNADLPMDPSFPEPPEFCLHTNYPSPSILSSEPGSFNAEFEKVTELQRQDDRRLQAYEMELDRYWANHCAYVYYRVDQEKAMSIVRRSFSPSFLHGHHEISTVLELFSRIILRATAEFSGSTQSQLAVPKPPDDDPSSACHDTEHSTAAEAVANGSAEDGEPPVDGKATDLGSMSGRPPSDGERYVATAKLRQSKYWKRLLAINLAAVEDIRNLVHVWADLHTKIMHWIKYEPDRDLLESCLRTMYRDKWTSLNIEHPILDTFSDKVMQNCQTIATPHKFINEMKLCVATLPLGQPKPNISSRELKTEDSLQPSKGPPDPNFAAPDEDTTVSADLGAFYLNGSRDPAGSSLEEEVAVSGSTAQKLKRLWSQREEGELAKAGPKKQSGKVGAKHVRGQKKAPAPGWGSTSTVKRSTYNCSECGKTHQMGQKCRLLRLKEK